MKIKIGNNFTLNDGLNVVVDKSDALHIANKSANKKTAEISAIDKLIKTAVVYADETNVKHNKFDYFAYYQAFVKYGKDTFPVYLNIGKAKNDGNYHLYDITQRIRDTAHRINGVERLREFRSINGISNNSIPTFTENVNKKSVKRNSAEIDTEYLALALAKNPEKNESRLRELIDEAAKANGYSKDESWKMDHKAPNSQDGYSNSMDNIDKSYNSDGSIYSPQAVYYYGEGRKYDNKAISVIKSAKNNPEKMITIYRAVPNDIKDTRMRNGDWVAIVKEYAVEHGNRVLDDDYRIVENTVPAKQLFSNGDSINEWGYDDGNNYVYKNTANNVKSADLVTYDDDGNIIPLSERFNEENEDIRYSKKEELSVKEQLKNSLSILNSMDVVASVKELKNFNSKQDTINWVLNRLKNTGYKVNRNGFGDVILDKKRIANGLRYLKTNDERLAFAVVPQVLAKGIEIGTHTQHKERTYDTVTFAAPIEINGQRGNLAVVVRKEGKNYYKVHRLVMPDGSQFIVNIKTEDTSERAGGVQKNSGLSPTDNVFENSILQTTEESQEKFSKKNLSDREILANALETAVKNDFERTLLSQYKKQIDILNKQQEKLVQIKKEIKNISFGKGTDRSQLPKLKEKANKLSDAILMQDKKLLNLEANKHIKDILIYEKEKAKKRYKEDGRKAIETYIEAYREDRNKTITRNQITRLIAEFNTKLLNPKGNRYIPKNLIKPVSEVLLAIDIESGRSVNLSSRLASLKVAYDSLKNDPRYDIVTLLKKHSRTIPLCKDRIY